MDGSGDVTVEEAAALRVLRLLADDVLRLGDAYRAAGEFRHPDDIGAEREAALLRALVAYAAPDILLAQGIRVEDPGTGVFHGEHDVVLLDPHTPALCVARSTGRATVAPQWIHAAVEVKSRLDGPRLFDALDHVAALRAVPRVPPYVDIGITATVDGVVTNHVPICGLIAAYTSSLSLATIQSRVSEWAARNPHTVWPACVAVLDRGVVGWCDPGTGLPSAWPHRHHVAMRYEPTDPETPLTALVSTLVGLQEAWHTPDTPRRERPFPQGLRRLTYGRPVRPPGVPEPRPCDHGCISCHYHGRMSLHEQRKL